jgi:putative oxidoreductase
MKKLFSTSYSATAFDIAIFILRVSISSIMFHHGYTKIEHFSEMQEKFINFLGLGPTISLSLSIFAEVGCSILLILGLMTRLAIIPNIINMIVALFVAHNFDIFGKGELAAVYLIVYISLIILGPGGYSLDAMISKK